MSSRKDQLSVSKFITVKEAANLSSYTPAYLTRLAKNGDLEAKKEGRIWLIKAKSLENYLNAIERRKADNRARLRAERISTLSSAEYSAAWLFQKANLGVFDAKAALESLAIAGLSALVGLIVRGYIDTGSSPNNLSEGIALIWEDFGRQTDVIVSALASLTSEIAVDSMFASVWSLFF